MYIANSVGAIDSIHTKENLAAYQVDPVEFFTKVRVHDFFTLGPMLDEFQCVYSHIVDSLVAFTIEVPRYFRFFYIMGDVVEVSLEPMFQTS